MSNQFAYGTVTGTGAAINVVLGWLPDRVEVLNVTDGDTYDLWIRGMADGTSVTIAAAAATRAANGISSYSGGATASKGFTIGSGISENAKVLYWTAQRYMP